MYGYSIDDLLPPEPAATAAPSVAVVPVEPTPVEPERGLSQEEIQEVGNLPPSVQNLLAPLIQQHSANPAMLASMVREVLDLQERIGRGENPPASPELAAVKEQLQQVEQDKRDAAKDVAALFIAPLTLAAATVETASINDPLQQNMLVNASVANNAAEEEWRRRQNSITISGVPTLQATPAFASVESTQVAPTMRLAVEDMGPTTAALAAATNGFTPTSGIPGKEQGRGLDSAALFRA